MTTLSEFRERIAGQITPRMAYGLVALMAIGLFLGVDELSRQSDALAESVAELKAEAALLQDETSAALWIGRATQAIEARKAWEDLDWSAETPGIASAEIQALIASLVEQSRIKDARVQVTGDPAELNGRRVLRFEVTALSDAAGFLRAVVRLSVAKKRLVINEMTTTFSQDGQPGRIFIAGYAPYRGVAQADEQVDGGQPTGGAP